MPEQRQGADGRPGRAAASPGQQAKSVSPARWATFRVLMEVGSTSAHSDDLLHGAELRKLSQADRNLATALVMGVLRWQIALDAELAKLLARPEQPLPLEVRVALRMGAFQLRHMDRVPPHAALSESVELARAAGHPKAAGLVNAVLRKLVATKAPGKPIVESVDAMATRLGHPAWMVRRWEGFYGREAAMAICGYDQHEPARGDLFLPNEAAEHVDVNLIDDGSRLIAELAAASHRSPQRIWDACAAPGGKTAVLARRHPAAEVLATDVSGRRLQSMERRLEHEMPGRKIRTLQVDAAELPAREGRFDLILCDVPCSGTGTLARNPEIRHRLEANEFERQAVRQRRILSEALKRLNPGGCLLYSTCSLEHEENEAVVNAVLGESDTRQRLRMVSIGDLLQRLRSDGIVRQDASDLTQLAPKDTLRTLPGANFQGDGFFAAVFAREV
ncbi:MAG TPA: transcription antitermination factor NusB [Acidobacteriaceae bacterium]|nr:transcription antitermination factor NusB [Acidobacteriaceae bacterium]